MNKLIQIVFIGLVIVHLSAIIASNEVIGNFSKPLLVSTLLLWFWQSTLSVAGNTKIFFGLALLFSIIGDTILMAHGANSFLWGLSSFLIAHIFYILVFYKYPNFKKGILFQKSILILPIAIYLLFFQYAIFDYVPGSLRFPVILYSFVISFMLLSSLNMIGRVSNQLARLVIIGASLFLLSDSILACEKFGVITEVDFRILRISVMATYLAGQYFLTKGLIKIITST